MPQPPQLSASVAVRTHWLPQATVPAPQRQVPAKQPTEPGPHTLPHAPQLLGSMAVTVHVPLQLVKNGAQLSVQRPSWHASIAPQVLPQPPQLSGSI